MVGGLDYRVHRRQHPYTGYLMSDGKKLIASMLHAGSVETLRKVQDEVLHDDELLLFNYVKAHYRRYAELPNIGTVERECRVRLPSAPEPIDYYVKKVYDRKLFIDLKDRFGGLRDCLTAFDVDGAKSVVADMQSLCRVSNPDTDLRNAFEAAQLVVRAYEVAHANLYSTGVPTGWPTVDDITGGYQRGDLIAYIARLGMGKTYILLKQAIHAWNLGYNVLFVTMEMTIEQIMRRAIGVETGINPDLIRKGMLDVWSTPRLHRYAATMRNRDRFHLYAGSFKKKVSDVDILIHEICPDVVYIDSAYLLNPSTPGRRNRIEKVGDVYDELKQVTITADRPIVTSSQFSRQAGKKGKEGSLENVAFSDAIAQHASLVFSIRPGETPYEELRRIIEFMKGREGEKGETVINYKFQPVDLSEVSQEEIAETQCSLDWQVE